MGLFKRLFGRQRNAIPFEIPWDKAGTLAEELTGQPPWDDLTPELALAAARATGEIVLELSERTRLDQRISVNLGLALSHLSLHLCDRLLVGRVNDPRRKKIVGELTAIEAFSAANFVDQERGRSRDEFARGFFLEKLEELNAYLAQCREIGGASRFLHGEEEGDSVAFVFASDFAAGHDISEEWLYERVVPVIAEAILGVVSRNR